MTLEIHPGSPSIDLTSVRDLHGVVLDSDVGGFPVLRTALRLGIYSQVSYVADGAWYPYGAHSSQQLRKRLDYLLARIALLKINEVCLGCNSISCSHRLRSTTQVPSHLVVRDMIDSAVHATLRTCSRHVGLIGTKTTVRSKAYDRAFCQCPGVGLEWKKAAPKLVDLVHQHITTGKKVEDAFLSAVKTMLNGGVESIILACSHFELIRPTLAAALPQGINLVEPSQSFFDTSQPRSAHPLTEINHVTFYTTGDPGEFAASIMHYLGIQVRVLRLPE